jgi:phosphocarrier protein HPr
MNKGHAPSRSETRPTAVLKRHMVIRNQRGLHARAAAKFVKLVGQFDADVRVARAGQTVSGHSIMGLMMLAAGPGMEIEIAARGPAARAALDAIQILIESGFDEKD